MIDYLNSPEGYLRIQDIALVAGSLFFGALFLYMLYLRPKISSLDFGWTWIIFSVFLLLFATKLLQEYYDFEYIFLFGSLVWLNLLASVVFTLCHFTFRNPWIKGGK